MSDSVYLCFKLSPKAEKCIKYTITHLNEYGINLSFDFLYYLYPTDLLPPRTRV